MFYKVKLNEKTFNETKYIFGKFFINISSKN